MAPPEFSRHIIPHYLADTHFVLLALAIAGAVYLLRAGKEGGRRVALVTAMNLAIKLAFFLSHPAFTPCYTIPVTMLSLRSLFFASLMQDALVWTTALPGRWRTADRDIEARRVVQTDRYFLNDINIDAGCRPGAMLQRRSRGGESGDRLPQSVADG